MKTTVKIFLLTYMVLLIETNEMLKHFQNVDYLLFIYLSIY